MQQLGVRALTITRELPQTREKQCKVSKSLRETKSTVEAALIERLQAYTALQKPSVGAGFRWLRVGNYRACRIGEVLTGNQCLDNTCDPPLLVNIDQRLQSNRLWQRWEISEHLRCSRG